MKTFYLIFIVVFVLQFNGFAQTSFPLDVGNKWYYQGKSTHRDYFYGAIKEIIDTLSGGFKEVTAQYFYKDTVKIEKEFWGYIGGKFYVNTTPTIDGAKIIYNELIIKDSCISSRYGSTCNRIINYNIFDKLYSGQKYASGSGNASGGSNESISIIPEIGIVKSTHYSYSNTGIAPTRSDTAYLIGMYNTIAMLGDTTFQAPIDTITAFFPLNVGNKWTYYVKYDNGNIGYAERKISKILSNNFREVSVTYSLGTSTNKEYWLYQNNKLYISTTPNIDASVCCYNTSLMGDEYVYRLSSLYPNPWGIYHRLGWDRNYIFNNKEYSAQFLELRQEQSSPFSYYTTSNNLGLVELYFRYGDNPRTETLIELILTDVDTKSDQTSINYSLSQNYPNPFNPTTMIKYSVVKSANVSLKVYDVLGNEVTTLVNEEKQPGSYEVEFQSTNGSPQLASGIYFYQLRAGDFIQTKKMLLLR